MYIVSNYIVRLNTASINFKTEITNCNATILGTVLNQSK